MQVQEELLVVSKDHTQMIIKGKRTKRQRAPSPLRLAMPNSSSSSTNNSIDSATTSPVTTTIELREEEDMANCLILLAQGRHHVTAPTPHHNNNNNNNNNNDKSSLYLYQCKTCNRCFPSFQALGGHRASHKRPKQNGTFSEAVTTFVNIEENDRYDPTTSTTLSLKMPNGVNNNVCSTSTATTTKAKVHECSICGAEFSSGQALGGHMRRHRTLVNAYSVTTSASGGNVGGGSHENQEAKKPLKLDLNLPAPDDDHGESKFSFPQRENVIVFSTSSLVDCHY
ncbi:Zinc finger protein ZAT5 [Spatholobus suberectus]|nr:Zinc finger protein ZAT5 [Spatholobus suberectus]